VHGLGDPTSLVRAEAAGSALRSTLRWSRSENVGNTDSGIHPFDFTREEASLRLEHPGTEVTGGLGLTWGRRDGLSTGTRSIGNTYVPGVAVRTDEMRRGASGDLAFAVLGWDAGVEAGYEDFDASDRRDLSAPSPIDPGTQQSEDYDADLDGRRLSASTRLARAIAGGRGRAEIGVAWYALESDADARSLESGVEFDPSLPFQRTSLGETDLSERGFSLDAGLRWEAGERIAWRARYVHDEEDERGDAFRDVTTLEIPNPPPTHFTELQRMRDERILDLLELGLEAELDPRTTLEVTGEAGLERVDAVNLFESQVLASFDDTLERFGAWASVATEWGDARLSLSGGYRVAPRGTGRASLEYLFEDERGLFASTRLRWRNGGHIWVASLTHQQVDADDLGSDSSAERLSLQWTPPAEGRWSGDAACTLRYDRTHADATLRFALPSPHATVTEVEFETLQQVLSGSVACFVHPRLEPRLAGSAVLATGDASYHYGTLLFDVPYALGERAVVGVELGWRRFDDDEAGQANDFTAYTAVAYTRFGF
jgi:hypothetical protein